MQIMEAELCIESCVRGHHVFKRTWTPCVGEELSCKRESDKNKDPYAVAVMRRGTVVGHSYPDTSREKFPDPIHQMTWNIGGI